MATEFEKLVEYIRLKTHMEGNVISCELKNGHKMILDLNAGTFDCPGNVPMSTVHAFFAHAMAVYMANTTKQINKQIDELRELLKSHSHRIKKGW